jgi:hypothetical protein
VKYYAFYSTLGNKYAGYSQKHPLFRQKQQPINQQQVKQHRNTQPDLPNRCFSLNSYNANMPTISTFYGILIRMFFNDHAPPHFHVQYAEFKATVEIKTLTIASGELPRRAQELVLDWAELHQQELLEDWRLCMEKQQPNAIAPLK